MATPLGLKRRNELRMSLPHGQFMVDLRTWDTPDYAEADPEDVVRLMAPAITRAPAAGVTAIVECSPVGVGRRADIDRTVSEATQLPLIVPTGIYRVRWP